MYVSVVVPTYNKLPRLSLMIASLMRQTFPFDRFEVIVIDDGSTDGTADYLRSLRGLIPLTHHPAVHAGRSAARNWGVRLARYDLVILVDDDVLLVPEFIEEHVRAQADQLSIVHGRIINLPFVKFFKNPSTGEFYPHFRGRTTSPLVSACVTAEDIVADFDAKIRKERHISAIEWMIEQILVHGVAGPQWLAFTGGNVAAPRQWLIDNPLDEGFGTDWGCEDFELGWRLMHRGFPFRYSYPATVYHLDHFRFNFDAEQARTCGRFVAQHQDADVEIIAKFIGGQIGRHRALEMFRGVRSGVFDPRV
jgi:glycosyltransferase involved in cell wall biosynthesis